MKTLLPKEHIDKLTRFSRYDIEVLQVRLPDITEKEFIAKNICRVSYKDDWWLLRNFVTAEGKVLDTSLQDPTRLCYLRPVLEFNNNKKMRVGDEFTYFGENFIVISIHDEIIYAFCLNDIGMCKYSEIPKKMQDWYKDAIAKYTIDKFNQDVANGNVGINGLTGDKSKMEIKSNIDEEDELIEYQQRMLDEYEELSKRIDSLYRFYTKRIINQRPHLSEHRLPPLKYPIALLDKQYQAMKDYQLYLRLRLIAEGFDPEIETPDEKFDF